MVRRNSQVISESRHFGTERALGRKCRNLILLLILPPLLTISSHSYAQNAFERTYGGSEDDSGLSVCQTTDGGYIIAGFTRSFDSGISDVYIIKTNDLGDTLWTRTYGDSLSEGGYSVQQTTDGGYIIAGYTYSFGAGSSDVYLIKMNELGNTLWTKTYGDSLGSFGQSVQETSDGGFIVAGYTQSLGAGDYDVNLIKTNSLGDTLWTKTYGGGGEDFGQSVEQTTDGGYIITGYTSSFDEEVNDVYLIKTDSLGDTLWTRTIGGSDHDYGFSVRQTSDGGYIVAGQTFSLGEEDGSDVYLIRTDGLGNTLWTKIYGRSDDDYGGSVQETGDGGYIVAGSTASAAQDTVDIYLVRTTASGDTLWTRTYGGDDPDEAFSVQQTSDGEFIITGYTESPGSGFADVYLIHTDTRSPTFLNAVASDNAILLPGIDDDDQMLIQFDEPTNQPLIDATNIDQVISLSGGHTWKDAFGAIGGAVWNPAGDSLIVSLSTDSGPPTVAVGDTITPDGMTITDLVGNSAATPVVITGSFDPPVGIDDPDEKSLLPKAYSLSQNYPNPFNPMTTIRYTIPEVTGKVSVRLTIHDLRGRLVRQLFEGEQSSGYYQLTWDGRDESGQAVGSGIYLYSIHAGTYVEKMKMTMIR